MKISEIITDKYKLRIPPTVYYDLLADVQEMEEEQEPTTKNDSSELEKNSKKLEKNFGELDCISRADVLKLMQDNWHTHNGDWAMQESMDDIRALPSVTPQLSVPEVTAFTEWIEKLTKASEEAYNKGYADGKKEQEPKNCEDCEIVQGCIEAGIRSTSKALSILDKLRAEIETKYGQCDICEYFEDYDYEENDISEYRSIGNIADILQIIDKYKAEQER